MENVPSEAEKAVLVNQTKDAMDRYAEKATHVCAPAVGNYLVLVNELLKQMIDTISQLTGDMEYVLKRLN